MWLSSHSNCSKSNVSPRGQVNKGHKATALSSGRHRLNRRSFRLFTRFCIQTDEKAESGDDEETTQCQREASNHFLLFGYKLQDLQVLHVFKLSAAFHMTLLKQAKLQYTWANCTCFFVITKNITFYTKLLNIVSTFKSDFPVQKHELQVQYSVLAVMYITRGNSL